METFEVTTDDGKIYSYNIDRSGDTGGYSMYTSPITSPIISVPKIITKEILGETYLMSRDYKSLKFCNIEKDVLVGKYFDNDGYIYYTTGGQLYRFAMKLVYFEKRYRRDRKGKITHKHPRYGLSVVEFDDGSLATIDIDSKEILLESSSENEVLWFVMDKRGWNVKKLDEPMPFCDLEKYRQSKKYNICNP